MYKTRISRAVFELHQIHWRLKSSAIYIISAAQRLRYQCKITFLGVVAAPCRPGPLTKCFVSYTLGKGGASEEPWLPGSSYSNMLYARGYLTSPVPEALEVLRHQQKSSISLGKTIIFKSQG